MKLKIHEAMQLASLHHRHKRYAKARALYEKIVKAQPDHAKALHQLAIVARDGGEPEIAVDYLLRTIEIDKGLLDAYRDLAHLRRELGDHEGVVEACESALKVDPDNLAVLLTLGNALLSLGRQKKAVEVMRRRVEMRPNEAQSYFHLGRALAEYGLLEDAVTAYRRCLQFDPTESSALSNLAQAYSNLRNEPRAISLYRQTLKKNPRSARAHYGLSRIKTFTPQDPRFEAMLKLSKSPMNDTDRGYLLFALARAYDDIGAYDEAFEYARQANELRARSFPHSRSADDKYVDAIMAADAAMDPDLWADQSDGPTHIVVVGLSRSGKSLVEALLTQSKGVLAGGEKPYISLAIDQIARMASLPSYPGSLPKLKQAHLGSIARQYAEMFIDFAKHGETHVVTTSPMDFQFVGTILRCLPGAKIIYCRRNTLDHALNIYFQRYQEPHSYAYDLADAAHNIARCRRMMEYWIKAYGSELILTVQYEDLVANPSKTLRAIADGLGLGPMPIEVSRLLHANEVGHWRHYARHLAALRSHMPEPGDQRPGRPNHAAG